MGYDLKMDRHLEFLAAKILALGCNPKSNQDSTQFKVQSGIFLSQLLDQKDRGKKLDIGTLPGYRFNWHKGPLSESLHEDWKELRTALEVYGSFDLEFVPHRQKHCLRVASEIHTGPTASISSSGEWAFSLATRGYLLAAGWTQKGAREEMNSLDNVDFFEETEIILHKLL